MKNYGNLSENRKGLIIGRVNRLKPCDNHVYLFSRLRMSWYCMILVRFRCVSVWFNCLLCSIKRRIVIKRYENRLRYGVRFKWKPVKINLTPGTISSKWLSLRRGGKSHAIHWIAKALCHTHNTRVIKKIYLFQK